MEHTSTTGDEFVTRYPKEIKTFVWRIEDLATIIDLNKSFSKVLKPWPSPRPSIQFDAGESIGMPSKWRVELSHDPFDLYMYLRLACVEGKVSSNNVLCEASIKKVTQPDSNLKVIDLRPKVGTPLLKQNALLQTFGKELPIHLKFTMCASPVTTKEEEFISTLILRNEDMNLGVLLETGYNSDFVVKVKKPETEDEWVEMKVHKAILGTRCQYFERMLDTVMTESLTGTLKIVDLSPECVKVILKWIYSGILDEDWKKVPEEVIKAGDMYGLTPVVQFLDGNLHHACNFENAINLRDLAKLHGLEYANKRITKFIAVNLERVLD